MLLLLDAAEQVGIAPLPSARLHAFAYLADVLSPVWDLVPFDGKVYKADGGPRYPDLQAEIDSLVVLGLIQVRDLVYEPRADGARIVGSYGLNFGSEHLEWILRALGARSADEAIDPDDRSSHAYLVELAGALATLPDDEIESATRVDVTYRARAELSTTWSTSTSGWRTDGQRIQAGEWPNGFRRFCPQSRRCCQEKSLYLYAAYLGRAMHAG